MNIYHGLHALGSALTLISVAISATILLRLMSDDYKPGATSWLPLIAAPLCLVIGMFLKGATS